MTDTQIEDELRALRVLYLDNAEKQEAAEAAELAFKQKRYEVYKMMEDRNIGTTTVDGLTFVPKSTTYHSMQDKAAFIEWAEENAPELIQLEGRKALLNELVREKIENGEELPPGLGFFDRELISQPRP